jgi:hypothetical protein
MKNVLFFLFISSFGLTSSAKDLEAKIILSQTETARFLSLAQHQNWPTEQMQIRFFDSPSLALFKDGVVIRIRTRTNKAPELTLKLRPFAENDLSNSWIDRLPSDYELKCELDAHLRKSTESCSLSRELSATELRQFEKSQEAFSLLQTAELEFLDLKTSIRSGVKLKTSFQARLWKLPKKMTAELWIFSDGSQVLEISKKVDSQKAVSAFEELIKWAKDYDLRVDPNPTNKTEKALNLR